MGQFFRLTCDTFININKALPSGSNASIGWTPPLDFSLLWERIFCVDLADVPINWANSSWDMHLRIWKTNKKYLKIPSIKSEFHFHLWKRHLYLYIFNNDYINFSIKMYNSTEKDSQKSGFIEKVFKNKFLIIP